MTRRSIPYSLLMIWRDRYHFLPALLAVAFSAVLIAVQCGLVMGLVLCASAPIDHADADIWVLHADAPSLQQSYPFPMAWRARLDMQPEIVRSEEYVYGLGGWRLPGRGQLETCYLIGLRLDEDSAGALHALTPEMRARLAEPGAIVIDSWELDNLGLDKGVGEKGEINGKSVHVVGLVHGFHGHNFVYVFCSIETVRFLLQGNYPDLTMAMVARCREKSEVDTVVARLRREYPDMGTYSRDELSIQARTYWLFRSRGGMVMICTMVLALLVGLVITSQTLFSAVAAHLREYAVLDALGIPRWRMVALVLSQSFWLGLGGVFLALPITYVLSWAALIVETRVVLTSQIVQLTIALTLGMAMIAGISALRPLRGVEPANLLR